MMALLAQIGGAVYCLVALVIGLRLMWLWSQTRQLPELLIGTSVLCLAGIGYPLSAVARETPELADGVRAALGATAGLLSVAGVASNTAFIWVLFRQGEGWARVLLWMVCAAALGLYGAQSLVGGWAKGALFWSWLPALITVSFGWAFVECGRYHLVLRRRLRLGIADVVVADRFRLYAIATGLAVVTNVSGWVFWHMGLEMISHPVGGFLLFALGTTSSLHMLLAFLPPRAYLDWVSARAPEMA